MPDDPLPMPPAPESAASRREFLKAALGAALAASLPDEWTPPVVEAGVLPAHALITPWQPPEIPFTAPYEFTASAQPGRQIGLTWQAGGYSTFMVERSTDQVNWTVFDSGFSQPSKEVFEIYRMTDTVPEAGITYYYRVYGYNKEVNSSRSNVVGVTSLP